MARDGLRGDSPLIFVIIRGALWGVVGGLIALIMTELLGLISTGARSLGIPTLAGGVPAVATGLLAGVLVAITAHSVVGRREADAQLQSLQRVVGVLTAVIAFAVGLAALLWLQADTGFISGVFHWIMSLGMLALGICVPVTGFAIWAAGKTYAGYQLRFVEQGQRP